MIAEAKYSVKSESNHFERLRPQVHLDMTYPVAQGDQMCDMVRNITTSRRIVG
ncbi:MAG: hypothetical protein RIF41_35095 [Polyangiaceae bacterium]